MKHSRINIMLMKKLTHNFEGSGFAIPLGTPLPVDCDKELLQMNVQHSMLDVRCSMFIFSSNLSPSFWRKKQLVIR